MNCLLSLISLKTIKETTWGAPGIVHLYPPTHIHGFTTNAWRSIIGNIGGFFLGAKSYAPPDPRWNISSAYHKTGIVPLIHMIGAKVGLGEGIAVFFTKI